MFYDVSSESTLGFALFAEESPLNSMFTLRRNFVGGAALGLAVTASSSFAASPPVLLGGTSTMTDMLVAANTDAFRAAGGGLYAHQSGWVPNLVYPGDAANSTRSQDNRKAIVNLFKPNNVGQVEFSYGPPADWTNAYRSYYVFNGLTADTASINFLSGRDDGNTSSNYPASNADAFTYIDALKGEGISKVNIILSPNNNATDAINYKFDNARWDDARTRATYGGGWTSDAPPGYFFNERDQNYRDWVIAQTKWTNANGLKSVNIISPRTSGTAFFAQSVQYVRYFEVQNAIPKQWVVENYSYVGEPPAGYVNRIGSEDDANNLAYTAKWLIGHVQGRPQSLDLWANGSTGTTGRTAFSTAPATNRVTLPLDSTARTFTINLENLGTNLTNDFYAAELSALITGDASHWAYSLSFNGTDVTAALLGDGFTLSGANLLDAGKTGAFTLTVQRLSGATGAFSLNFYARANPNATVVADTISFAAAVPEPASVGALLAGAGLILRRRRRTGRGTA